jgi:uncharacterized repeat protein (TIGR04076 family)
MYIIFKDRKHLLDNTSHHIEGEIKTMSVSIRVKTGKCQGGIHKAGDEIAVDWTTPEGMCLGAWEALSSSVITLLCGGNFPWEKEKGYTTIHCPDPKGITFVLRRIE